MYFPKGTERTNGFRVGSDVSGTNQARGQFDELETFNYPLSASDINSNYQASAHRDKDGHGLSDVWQWSNFGHQGVDPNADPDGDGLSNLEEYEDGTDPNHFDQARLGYWRFNNPTNWTDESGLNPSIASAVVPVASWSGDAAKISSSFIGVLGYPGIRADGSAVLSSSSGTIRFWFKPDWTTYSGYFAAPANYMSRLFELGRQSPAATYGWFALTMNPAQNALTFSTEANGVHTDNDTYSVNFNSTTWYQIVLTYTPSNTCLYVDGQGLATNGIALTNVPNTVLFQQGFMLGCSWDGVNQANGSFDELETFNYPLSATDIVTNYQTIMSVDTDGDGLPDVVENAIGSRPDAVDTDCDGLPDAWEVAHGLNPNDPSDATPAMLALYASGNTSSPSFALTAPQTNMINVGFVTDATNMAGLMLSGTAIKGPSSNDAWNFCDINSDYLHGISLQNGATNATGAKLYAYLGPCVTPFVCPPILYGLANSDYVPYITTNTLIEEGQVIDWFHYRTNASDTNFLAYGFNANSNSVWASGYPTFGAPYWFSIFDPTLAQVAFNSDWFYEFATEFTCQGSSPNPPQFPFDYGLYDWNTNGVYYSFNLNDYSGVDLACQNTTAYARLLSSFISSSGFSSPGEAAPFGCASCFVPPFKSVSHTNNNLNSTGGASWQYASTSTNRSGGWFKNAYPDAKRTLLISGLTNGLYGVYVYFDSLLAVAPMTANNVTAVTMATPTGTKYWYCSVSSESLAAPTNFDQCVNSSSPVWALTNSGGSIEIDLAAPTVFNSEVDAKILGLQVVRLGDALPINTALQAVPGSQVVYLNWGSIQTATNYRIYRAITTTNTWTLRASTPLLTYQDTNLTAGTTYFYKVAGVETGGTEDPASPVASAVPFGCASPLPPMIDFVKELQLPAANGTYPINYQTLLTNSDAFDPQGYAMVFKVDRVVSGSLIINGAPFSAGNNTISNNTAVTWIPPAVMAAAGTPSFRVYVFDGLNNSINTVNVIIKQHAPTHLFAWGYDYNGELGDGYIYWLTYPTPPPGYFDVLDSQAMCSIVPRDPRWHNDYFGGGWTIKYQPQRVLDLDNAIAVHGDDNVSLALGANGTLWQWGFDVSGIFGKRLVWSSGNSNEIYNWFYGGHDPTEGAFSASPQGIVFPTPMQCLLPSTGGSDNWSVTDAYFSSDPDDHRGCQREMTWPSQSPMTGIKAMFGSLDYQIVLEDDGSLWSWGSDQYGQLGRLPVASGDALANSSLLYGMSPGKIEIQGNNDNETIPGRLFVDVQSGSPNGLLVAARCQDGSVWVWGQLYAEVPGGPFFFPLIGAPSASWVPTRIDSLNDSTGSSIIQMSIGVQHLVVLRDNGIVSELGYVPNLDANGGVGANSAFANYEEDAMACYSSIPLTVDGLPNNIRQIAAGGSYGVAVTDQGNVWVWGYFGDTNSTNVRQIQSLRNIVKVVAGYKFLLALDQSGRIWGIGQDICALGPDVSLHPNAIPIATLANVTDVFCDIRGDYDTVVYAMGAEFPDSPRNVVAVAGSQAVQISWTDFPAASSYIIYRSLNIDSGYSPIASTPNTFYLDNAPPLQNGQTYYYTVSAIINGVETAQSSEVNATPMPPPDAVTNLTALWACHGVKLQWQPHQLRNKSAELVYRSIGKSDLGRL